MQYVPGQDVSALILFVRESLRGDKLADLHVNTQGLASAAVVGDDVAASLAADVTGGCRGSRQGHAGVAAMDEALASAREHQSSRATEFADSLRVSAGSYRHADDDGASDIVVTI